MHRPQVVIIGGGFAGIAAARVLRSADVDVALIDRTNHHVFQPLLYQVAVATLAPSDIAVPIRWVLRKHANTRVEMGEVTHIDVEARRVVVNNGEFAEDYDYLIVAAGARHAYFGRDEWEGFAPGLKSLEDALDIRRRFLEAFERAETASTDDDRAAFQTIVIIGGGPTGVELAGLMATIARDVMPDDFRRIDTRRTRVLLLEGGPRVLPAFPEHLSAEALHDVEELGVEVRLDSIVTRIEEDAVYVGDERIPTYSVFWAAGNAASPLGKKLGAPLDKVGRVLVEPDLSVPGHPEILVAGDLSAIVRENGKMVPGVAPAANQQGAWAARNILRTIRNQPRKPFKYFNKGDLATIGRHRAVADFGKIDFTGVPAWLLWLFIHIMYLVGFRNRITVLIQWAWAYFAYQRGSRLILGGRPRAKRLAETRGLVLVVIALLSFAPSLGAQWTNRYPKNAGFNHHVYLEGYELPIMANGALDAAASRAGGLVVASRGWLWRLDEGSGVATRLTSSGGVDSRPAWSPDGRRLVFVRDDSESLAVMVRDMESGRETEVDRGMALDPVFSADGNSVIYANSTSGDLDLWRADLNTGSKSRLTTEAGLELRPQLFPDGDRLVYTSKTRAGGDQVRLRRLSDGKESVLLQGSIVSQTRPALSPDGTLLVYNWPGTTGWEVRLMSTERPGVSILLAAHDRGRPVSPAWSADGSTVYFSEADARQIMRLYRVSATGGRVSEVAVRQWNWGVPMGRVAIRTTCSECGGPAAARLNVVDATGHPLMPAEGMVRFDGQNGVVYFYSSGMVEVEAPVGEVTVRGVRGLTTPQAIGRVAVGAGESREVTLDIPALWNPAQAGYYSGDHHFHLNYGGQFDLAPRDLLPLMAGEGLDVTTPMLANLHNRFEDQANFEWRSLGTTPIVRWAQEVRSHFLGHVGLIGTDQLFWPWVWGPGYEVFGRDDRLNAAPLAFARAQGGAGIYVHPVGSPAPFTEEGLASIPVALVADAAHGAIDLLEIVCLWSNAVGTTELWYRLLNAGFPVAPSGGTDAMTDFHRTMAIGSTRVYVRPDGPLTFERYLSALKSGKSFVTTGPMLDLTINGDARPGDVVQPKGGTVRFTLRAASASPVDSVVIMVNGQTMRTLGPLAAGTTGSWSGVVKVPRGGWIAARAIGPRTTTWPAMAEHAFAHTAPIWIGTKASTDPMARRAAVLDLLRALAVAEKRLIAGYEGSEIPRLRAYFEQARVRLEALAR